MPVVLEIINRPDDADLADLEKIYADYPLPPVQSLSTWLDDLRETSRTLIAGRFNGHLVAALCVDGDGCITDLCVRAATRRRGTARQLLQMLQKQAAQLQLPRLAVRDADTNTENLAALWQELGFARDGDGWQWTH